MTSTSTAERPGSALPIAKRYLRRERPLSVLVAVLAVSLFVGTYLAASLLPAVVVAVLLLVALRAPVLQSSGSIRLRTDADPGTVADSFAGPTPPVLALQWGIADEVTSDDGTATYRISYLLGTRTAEVTVDARRETTPDGNPRIEMEITENDEPWATYTATVRSDDDGTLVDVAYASDRRFGLRRLPQRFVAERYREEVLTVQGYSVVDRESRVGS
jgi:hypothetical protein